MARDGGTQIDQGVIARVVQGLRWAVAGTAPEAWFGPLDPMPPQAPASVAGRQFDYPSGYNLALQPRQAEPITFDQLRGLADGYDLMRLAIETRKDQIARLQWCFRAKEGRVLAPADPRLGQLTAFFASPDREHSWDSWLRMLVEDMLVIDAATVYPRRTQGGALYALEPVDGATIKRVLDDRGRTPEAPAPAYQQVLKGLPAVDYTRDELLYLPRNLRANKVYGFSPVEQVVMTVNIALRRQLHQLQYYTEGSIPDALIGVPETWTPEQIGQFQAYWGALLEGDTAQRRHARFVPATISKSYVQTKEGALKDEYDDWLARIVCYAFSVSPGALVRDMNRATAQTSSAQALSEGMLPLMKWVKDLIDRVVLHQFGYADIEFAWKDQHDIDPLTQAKINQIYLSCGVLTADEVREGLGLAALGGVAKAYNPDQARGTDGKWVVGGGGAATLTISAPAAGVGNPVGADGTPKRPAGTQVACAEDLCIGEAAAASAIGDAVAGTAIGSTIGRMINRYGPGSERCKEEWSHGREFCKKLDEEGKLGSDGYRGFGRTYRQCVAGQVSQACGGNAPDNPPSNDK